MSADIGRLQTKRDALLVVGTNKALAGAEAELKQAAATGETVMAMHAELQRRLKRRHPARAGIGRSSSARACGPGRG